MPTGGGADKCQAIQRKYTCDGISKHFLQYVLFDIPIYKHNYNTVKSLI